MKILKHLLWPKENIEILGYCPYCKGKNRNIAYDKVFDLSFDVAPGVWTYWDCIDCGSLYLDPRPDLNSISLAYKNYYTHDNLPLNFISRLKRRLKNECLSVIFKVDLQPRVKFLKITPFFIFEIIKSKMSFPFGLLELVSLKRGSLLDIGCGDGYLLNIASQLGWKVTGIEIDPLAVLSAKNKGLNILEGDYRVLSSIEQKFDCIIFSHVIEHLHDPIDALGRIYGALKTGGCLIISAPNASSYIRSYFGENWRGLECPRHLAIPTSTYLKKLIERIGFSVEQFNMDTYPTLLESIRIERRSLTVGRAERKLEKSIKKELQNSKLESADFIQFICTKN